MPLSTTHTPFSITTSCRRLGDTKHVTTIVPLHIFLEVEFEDAVGVGGAGGAEECGATTFATELARHVGGCSEAGVAAEDVGFEGANAL